MKIVRPNAWLLAGDQQYHSDDFDKLLSAEFYTPAGKVTLSIVPPDEVATFTDEQIKAWLHPIVSQICGHFPK